MASLGAHRSWGTPPWKVDFSPASQPLPASADFVIVGAGFTGLAAAAWLRSLAPDKSVVALEAATIGDGASGRTGGMTLAEAASGDLPGLGDVLAGYQRILSSLGVDADLRLPGAWEIARKGKAKDSAIEWTDSGTLRVVNEVPGGSVDPGKVVSGLARAAQERGAAIFEKHRVEEIQWSEPAQIRTNRGLLLAKKVLLATNGLSLRLSGLSESAFPKLTLAALSEPISDLQLAAIGLAQQKPFYTVDFPYLWGRTRPDNSIVWGAGLVNPDESGDLEKVDVSSADPVRMFANFQKRVRGLHLELADLQFTHQWGGPILFRENWNPVFGQHPESKDAIVLGAYAGHGVALSVYLGTWAAEALLGRRKLPNWGKMPPRGHKGKDPLAGMQVQGQQRK